MPCEYFEENNAGDVAQQKGEDNLLRRRLEHLHRGQLLDRREHVRQSLISNAKNAKFQRTPVFVL